ncbi:hypothetical protein [Puia sp.]|jgi:hypothetical protein|uniref:hypothetical protein n=1 Tax=Puia sp. TaxID=2045100 RepID=UPI002F42E894
MKKLHFFCFFFCVLLLASCRKSGEFLPIGDSEEQNTTTTLKHGQPNEKQFMLSRMAWYRSNVHEMTGIDVITFNFSYSRKGQLDSMQFDPQVIGGIGVHRIKDKGKIDTIFSTSPFTIPQTLKSGFEYDRHGNISGFTRTNQRNGQITPVVITYDQGYPHRITRVNTTDPSLNDHDIFTYNENNIARWTMASGSSRNDIKYTYDRKHFNPVYFIDDLVPIFSFELGWEFFLEAENVSASKFYVQTQQLVPFQNFFDRKGRLVKKVWTEPSMPLPDSLVFTYVN